MRISDWSSDVCSSDLCRRSWKTPAFHPFETMDTGNRLEVKPGLFDPYRQRTTDKQGRRPRRVPGDPVCQREDRSGHRDHFSTQDRKTAVQGKRVSVRVDLGGRGTLRKKKITKK